MDIHFKQKDQGKTRIKRGFIPSTVSLSLQEGLYPFMKSLFPSIRTLNNNAGTDGEARRRQR